MLSRDLIKDQIEQLAKMLAIVVSDFLGLKLIDKTAEGIEIANHKLQTELDIDVNQIAILANKELEEYLAQRNLHADHLNTLSSYLKELGLAEIETNTRKAKMWFQKAIDLLEIADTTSKEYSFARVQLKEKIEQLLGNISV